MMNMYVYTLDMHTLPKLVRNKARKRKMDLRARMMILKIHENDSKCEMLELVSFILEDFFLATVP